MCIGTTPKQAHVIDGMAKGMRGHRGIEVPSSGWSPFVYRAGGMPARLRSK